jgi:hypothetical protein
MRNLKNKNWFPVTVALYCLLHYYISPHKDSQYNISMGNMVVLMILYKEKFELLHNLQFSAQQEKRVTILRITGFLDLVHRPVF